VCSSDLVYIKLSENNYVKKLLDEYLEFKKENKNNENLTFEQSVDLLVEFCNINKRCPKPNEQYKNKNIYNFLQNLKKKVNNINNELYIKLSGNEYIKESLDKYLNKK
jgi:cellobiose-specific phosphotransferase system component IIB